MCGQEESALNLKRGRAEAVLGRGGAGRTGGGGSPDGASDGLCACSDTTGKLSDKLALVSLHLDPKEARTGCRDGGRESSRQIIFAAMFIHHLRAVYEV